MVPCDQVTKTCLNLPVDLILQGPNFRINNNDLIKKVRGHLGNCFNNGCQTRFPISMHCGKLISTWKKRLLIWKYNFECIVTIESDANHAITMPRKCIEIYSWRSYWRWVSIGSDNGLVQPGNTPLSGWMLTHICNTMLPHQVVMSSHDDVIKWKHFPRYWQFVRGIHRSPVHSPNKGQWRGALMFTLICARING